MIGGFRLGDKTTEVNTVEEGPAVGLPTLFYRRIDWERVVVLVSAGISTAVCLVGLVAGGFLLVVPLAAAVGSFVLLVRPDSRLWFHAR